MSPVLPSPFAFFLRKGPIPFVIGPLNGGLPGPGFYPARRAEAKNLWLEEFVPASAFLTVDLSSRDSDHARFVPKRIELARYRDKLFFIPENGIARSLCSDDARRPEPAPNLS